MKRLRTSILLLSTASALALALPAASQEAPESLLPPGFEESEQPLPPRPDPLAPRPPLAAPAPLPPLRSAPAIQNAAEQDLELLSEIPRPKPIEMPEWARRSPAVVGPLQPSDGGLGSDAFGHAHGHFLSTLMRQLDAPLPSRWGSILLRRALLSSQPAPSSLSPVDWVAERAWLLLRMGEADGARMLVQAVDVDQFTPKMFGIAVQSALANADPAGLCPLVEPGRLVSDEPVWPLADAMCAALEGEASRASTLIDQARRRSGVGGIDLLLAEKVVGAGTNTRRAVTIQWEPVDHINSWRFGLASATGLTIPDRLMSSAGAHVWAWQARAPMLPLEQRLAAANVAASLGVFSSAALVEIYSLMGDTTDPSEFRQSVAGRLRSAYVGGDADTRMTALHQLWDEEQPSGQRYARLILTAGAAARIAPSEARAADAASLIASMLTAGHDQPAARWSQIVKSMDAASSDRAWALLAIASPRPSVDVGAGRISAFAERDDSPGKMRSKLLFATLAGLDRISTSTQADMGEDLGVDIEARTRWSSMIDSAAQKQQKGTVALLAAIGMQTADWRGVPPKHLFHIIRALRLAGLEYEARMIGAEALSRL